MSVQAQADEIRDTFAFLDDWEARYEHIKKKEGKKKEQK